MKKVLYLLTLLMLLFAVSCEKPEENSNSDNKTEDSNNSDNKTEEDIFFGLNKESIVISPEGGSVDILVYSNHKWEIKGGSDWCTPSVTCGDANENGEKVSFSAELTYDDRETIFWFCCADEKITFVVTQKLKETIIPDANNTFDIPAEGGVATLNYQTNVECKVVIPESAKDWISVATASTRGLVDENIKLDIAENTTYSARTAVVKIVVSDNEEVYSEYIVNQKQNDGLIGDDDNINVSSIGGNVNLTYKTNVECKVIIPESAKDWITISPTTKTLNPQSTSLQISENNTYENRTAVVKVVAVSNDDLAIEYTINQEQNDAIIADDNRVFDVPFTGGDIRIDYQTNVDCKVVIPDDAKDWISVVPATRALTNMSTTLRISENTTYGERAAVIKVVKDGEDNPAIEYTINQEQNDAIIADDAELTINGWESSFSIQYKTNVECEIVIPDNAKEWLSIAPKTKALEQQSIILNAKANNTGIERSTIIQVVSVNNNEICAEYAITQNQRYLMEYTSENENVVTPNKDVFGAKIVSNIYENGRGIIEFDAPPTEIGEYGFQYCSELLSISIPNSITLISKSAFYGCSALVSITIPDSITAIKDNAFYNCSALVDITIPVSVTSIGKEVFKKCSKLSSITFLDSPTSIGSWAFSNCSNLKNISFGNNITSIDGFAFEYCSALTNITIPDSVTSIGQWAFSYCKGLTDVTIGDGVMSISVNAFNGCTSLNNVSIGNKVTSVEARVFYNCTQLTKVEIPNSVTIIGDEAFSGCSALKSVTIGNGVTSIGNNAFYKCSALADITVPDSVTSIGSYAFYKCSGLTSLTLGSGVTSIGNNAFFDCLQLTDVNISKIDAFCNIAFESLTSHPLRNGGTLYLNGEVVKEVIISNEITEIKPYAFAFCKDIENVTLSNSITSIGNSAFYKCSSLNSITIPTSVATIRQYAFNSCSKLANVYCKPTTPPQGGTDMFGTNATGRKIYVPTESLEAYKNSSYWNDYASSIEAYDFK